MYELKYNSLNQSNYSSQCVWANIYNWNSVNDLAHRKLIDRIFLKNLSLKKILQLLNWLCSTYTGLYNKKINYFYVRWDDVKDYGCCWKLSHQQFILKTHIHVIVNVDNSSISFLVSLNAQLHTLNRYIQYQLNETIPLVIYKYKIIKLWNTKR